MNDAHHRKLRSHGGDDSWGNQLRLPRHIHALIHAQPEVAYQHGMLVKSHDDPGKIEPDLKGFLQAVGIEGDPVEEKPKVERKKTDRKPQVNFQLPEGVTRDAWDELLEEAERVEQEQPDTQYEQRRGGISPGKLLVAVLERFTGRAGG